MAASTSKKNVPRGPVLNKKMKPVKLNKNIIITSKLWNRQQTTGDRRNMKDVEKTQVFGVRSKERSLTNM
jgi:hypothetical protein